jgi:NAD(P)-dependent dehydrogenase (short-subunit alcohol dehydrogenase family)
MTDPAKLFDLTGKVALVTGGSRGLGRAMVLAFAHAGADVVIASRKLESCEKLAEQVRGETGRHALPVSCHVGDWGQVEQLAERAYAHFGRVDVLVNNAGILRDKTLSKMDESMWDVVQAVHLRGTYCVTRPVFNHMKERGEGGVIISTSSTSGLEGNFGQSNYGAAKAGIWGFHNCLWQEGKKHDIRSFVLAPVALTRLTEDLGGFQSEELKARMHPRMVSPLVVFLASDLARDYTGKTFFVGGGRIAEMKMVRGEGVTKKEAGGLWTPEEIAARIDDILIS